MDKPTRSSLSSQAKTPKRRSERALGGIALLALCLYWFNFEVSWLLSQDYAICSKLSGVYTVDEANPTVECVAVRGSDILDTGSLADIQERRAVLEFYTLSSLLYWIAAQIKGPLRTQFIDPNHIVVPGLADAHAHTIEYGFKMQLPLDGSRSIQEVVNHLKEFILSHPDVHKDSSLWIEGMGWDQTKWPGSQFPTAADLDSDLLLRGRPIALNRVDGHAAWVSPRVLELIGDMPSEIDGGAIIRDANGNPTGVFLDNAMALIPRPEWSERKMTEYYQITMQHALAHGLTSIHDAGASPTSISFFKKQAEIGNLPIRLYVMGLVASDDYWGAQIPRLMDYGMHGRLNIRSIKLLSDGAIGSWGAAMLEPYLDKPETSGIMRSTPAKLAELVEQFWVDGWQVNVHCIGDRSNNVVLNIFEDIIDKKGANVTEWRPRIEHAQVMTTGDIHRMGRIGVIPSVQPTHTTSDMWFEEARLGPQRVLGAHAFRSMLNASTNKIMPLGSDFPVEGINPLAGFYAAVSRLSADGQSPHGAGGWFPEQLLTRREALKGMTLDAAYASFAENKIGSLVRGKKADLVVLDRDIMTIPVHEILRTRVVATIVDGEVVYGSL